MTGFTRHRKSGAAVTTFTAFEADLLRSLAGQLIELLRNESATEEIASDSLEDLLDFSGPTREPEDPVLARLFPTAYPEDEDAAAEFRRYTAADLRNGKAAGAAASLRSSSTSWEASERMRSASNPLNVAITCPLRRRRANTVWLTASPAWPTGRTRASPARRAPSPRACRC